VHKLNKSRHPFSSYYSPTLKAWLVTSHQVADRPLTLHHRLEEICLLLHHRLEVTCLHRNLL
jgi:hypothetical protein